LEGSSAGDTYQRYVDLLNSFDNQSHQMGHSSGSIETIIAIGALVWYGAAYIGHGCAKLWDSIWRPENGPSLSERTWFVRAMGGLQMIGGLVEGSAGSLLLGTPFAPLGVILIVHGFDHTFAGVRTVCTGRVAISGTAQVLEMAGLSPEMAGMVDSGISVFGTAGAGAYIYTGERALMRAVANFPATYRAPVQIAEEVVLSNGGLPTIGGRVPINSKFAGRIHSSGVRFTSQGFPDFGPYSKAEVRISGLTGNLRIDNKLANQAAGFGNFTRAPKGFVWHHLEDGQTMQLVPIDIHNATRHTGGAAVIRNGGFDR
jgi:A nuclease of the HNH/ENDO VII superfamily with conserved WHH